MNVLHTIPYFNKTSGGPVTCTYNLVKGLYDSGLNINILTFQPTSDEVLATDDFIRYLPDDRFTPLWFTKEMYRSLQDDITTYDIVHVNTIWTWPSHIAVKFARKYNKPLIISPHGMLYPQALRVSRWKKKIISNLFVKKDLRNAYCIHATSMEEAQHIRNYGINAPIAVIPNCIYMDMYPKQRTEANAVRRFGFVGRLNPIKNIDILLNAWNLLGDKTINSELVIIGDGEPGYVEYLKKIARTGDLNNITFCGFISGDTLRDSIHNLDYLVLPSKSENFGMVVAEALTCGVPAITSKGTPWKSLQDENAGWWINADISSIARTIYDAITLDEIQRQQMGQNGYAIINRNFSFLSVARKMTELYGWLLGENEKPHFVI